MIDELNEKTRSKAMMNPIKNRRIKHAIKSIQKTLLLNDDGIWGEKSTTRFEDTDSEWRINFAIVRKKFGRLTQPQVDGINDIMSAINKYKIANPCYVAYIFATAWHETAETMQPIEEIGKGRTRRYGRWVKNSKGEEYCYDDDKCYLKKDYPHLYYGRGYVQLTWLTNYFKASKELQIDFVMSPENALKSEHASKILVMGMLQGWFTSLALDDCIYGGKFNQFMKARKIINGNNKKRLIANHAVKFLDCLSVKPVSDCEISEV